MKIKTILGNRYSLEGGKHYFTKDIILCVKTDSLLNTVLSVFWNNCC
jgi:hypothetical protein